MTTISEKVRRELERQSRAAPTGTAAMPMETEDYRDTAVPSDLATAIKERLKNNTDTEAFFKAYWAAFGKRYRKD